MKPFQRICKYPLFLKELLKSTEIEDANYQDLKKAYFFTKKIVEEINETVRENENETKLVYLHNNLCWDEVGMFLDIIAPSRKLMFELDNILLINNRTLVQVLLFNDMLMVYDKQRKNMVKKIIPLSGVYSIEVQQNYNTFVIHYLLQRVINNLGSTFSTMSFDYDPNFEIVGKNQTIKQRKVLSLEISEEKARDNLIRFVSMFNLKIVQKNHSKKSQIERDPNKIFEN